MKKRWLIFIIPVVFLIGLASFWFWWKGGSARYVPATAAQYETRVFRGLAYWDGEAADPVFNLLDVYRPVDQQNRPAVMILHGGGWTTGSRRERGVQKIAEWFAGRGIIGVPTEYRLLPRAGVLEQAEDVARAVAWLYKHLPEYGGDPDNIFLLGHSAGAHLASLITCDRRYLAELNVPPSVPAGVITLGCPFDLRSEAVGSHPISTKTMRDAFGDDQALRERASPLLFVRGGLPPFLIAHAKGDHLIPATQAEHMVSFLRQAGEIVETLAVPGRTHVTLFYNMVKPGDFAIESILQFIRRQAKKTER